MRVPLYTPSTLPGEVLEALFVGDDRYRLVDNIVSRVQRATSSRERNHTLVVGRRGAGKTHLISLVHHRLQQLPAAERPVMSWLPEDPWLIDSYQTFLQHVIDYATPAVDASGTIAELEAVINGHQPVVVLCENLDQILDGLENQGQQRLRSFLQSAKSLLLIGTATALTSDLIHADGPFYNFFTTTTLQPFDPGQAAEMLTKAAAYENNPDLVRYLDTATGHARLETIAHLAGGQPRMWATLASTVSIGELDTLVDLLIRRFDELTPFYQEQLARLSPQQRRVVGALAHADSPLNAKRLAQHLGTDERSLSRTLHDLRQRQWVVPVDSCFTDLLADKRVQYYELAEPMARVVFQIKETRGEPLRVVAEFAKLWFDPVDDSNIELRAHSSIDGDLTVTRRLRGLTNISGRPALAAYSRLDTALADAANGHGDTILTIPTALRRAVEDRLHNGPTSDAIVELRLTLHNQARTIFGDVAHPDMLDWADRAEQLAEADPSAYPNLALWYGSADRFDEAQAALEAATRNLGSDHPDTLTTREIVALSYSLAGRIDEAIQMQEAVLANRERILGIDHPNTLTTRNNLALSYQSAGRIDEAIQMQEVLLTDRERILGIDHPNTLTTRNNLALSYQSAGRIDEAIQMQEAVLADSERILGIDHPDTLTTRNDLALSYWSASRVEEAIQMQQALLTDLERILGIDHPDTLTTRNNLATSYQSAGRIDETGLRRESIPEQ